MPRSNQLIEEFARQGAIARLREINDELQVIYASFPELRQAGSLTPSAGDIAASGRHRRVGPNKGRTFSPEVKTKMSEGMRKYWARRKAAAKLTGAGPKSRDLDS
jgi:hypothetical protein